MKLVIQKKSIIEFEGIEKAIIDNDQTFEQMYETWQILDEFFSQNYYEQEVDWRLTYFRVYVRLTWKVIGTIVDTNKFVEIMKRQVPMALLLDIDVLKEMMWYLEFNKADETQLVSLYQKIKISFLESDQVVGVWKGEAVTIKDLVSEYLLLHKRGAPSMEGAEFLSKVEQVMFPEDVDPYAFVEYDVGVDRFLELVEFFEKTTNDQIWFVVDNFLNPEKYNRDNLQNILPEAEVGSEESVEPVVKNLANKFESMSKNLEAEIKASESAAVAPAPAPKVELEKPVVVKQSPKEIPAPEPQKPAKLTTEQIKSQIESEFKKDVEGNFIDIEGVMRKLEEFAEMYNDSKIADLIYFDEDDNRFKWKV